LMASAIRRPIEVVLLKEGVMQATQPRRQP
jgi:hypothetical protein